MYDFTISLAGLCVGVRACCETTREFCAAFLCEQTPTFSVTLDAAATAREQAFEDQAAVREGHALRQYAPAYLERLALLRAIAERLPAYDALLFHGAVVALDGRAYLFTAPSGTGKTTHLRLWLARFPQAHVLNGDKPFLRLAENGTVLACGTPWQGKERLGCNEILPLEAICLLERAAENRIERVEPKTVLSQLLEQGYRPQDPEQLIRSLRLTGTILQRARLYRLRCTPDPAAAAVSSAALLC